MGCMYSKAIARSMSIREELNHGFHSSSVAWEELLTSHSGTDQLFAFVCSANTTTTKPRTSNVTLPSTDIPETETAPETKYGESGADDPVGKHDSGLFPRSKSCHLITETETYGTNENKLDWRDKSLAGSRSFHTVEEYDALLERIRKFSTRSVQHFEDCYSSEDVKLEQTNDDLDEHPNDKCIQRIAKDEPGNFDSFEKVVQVDGAGGTGWKRKAIAKGLKPLEVSTIEFPDTARSRQRVRVEDGQIYSPGTYVTPKFGSYNERVTSKTQEKDGGESSVFSQELLTAFEDCMQQLQDEEENILRQMDRHLPAEDENGENQVEVPSDMKIDI